MNPPDSILDLIDQGMGPELHWYPESVSPGTLAETFSGMANEEGGRVLLGVSPRTGQVQGIRDSEGVIDVVFQAALLTDPPLVLPLPTLETAGEFAVLSILIPAGLPHIYTVNGRYLGREGRHNTPLPPGRLRRKLIERGVLHFEARVPPEAGLDDLDPDLVEDYAEALALSPDEDGMALLLRRGCLHEEGGELRPTYAGLLLFGKHPQRWVPNALVLAARFSGAALSAAFIKQEIQGTLPAQLRRADTFVRENLQSVVRLQGLVRQEQPEYPLEAVRELLVNAVAHRDYSNQGDSTHLHIFSNRLEVHSPGLLPGPVTLDNLLQARFSRNPVIVQVLSDMGFIERLGYGLDRVVQVMADNGLGEPVFQETAGTFRVALSNAGRVDAPVASRVAGAGVRYRELKLNPRQVLAIGYVEENRRITNSDYAGICPDVHAETLRRDLADLVKKQVLLKIGHKRGTYYILK